jgi:hypothetical protein
LLGAVALEVAPSGPKALRVAIGGMLGRRWSSSCFAYRVADLGSRSVAAFAAGIVLAALFSTVAGRCRRGSPPRGVRPSLD